MPHTLTWSEDGLLREFNGEISPSEILKSNFELQENSCFEKIKYIINDFNNVTGVDINDEHTKVYASTDDITSETKGKFKIAIVAKQEGIIALAENYRQEMKNKNYSCEIFKAVEEAKKWGEI